MTSPLRLITSCITSMRPIRGVLQRAAKLWRTHPESDVTPVFGQVESLDVFLRGEQDVVFTREDVHRVPGIQVHPLYQSRIYLVSRKKILSLAKISLPPKTCADAFS